VLSHTLHEPSQHSLSCAHEAPTPAPEVPPQVLSHVPHVTAPQQSLSSAQPPPAAAHPHVPPAHVPEQQSPSAAHVSPSWLPDLPPQVLSQVPHVGPPQQSESTWHVAPTLHGGPHTPAVHTKPSALQQSPSFMHASPC